MDRPNAAQPRSYRHVVERVFDHPWALNGGPTGANPELLFRMAEIVQMRLAGDVEPTDMIEQRLAAARAEQGDRLGSALVNGVAVIPVYGLISQRTTLMSAFSGGTSTEDLRDALRTALADPDVAAIVLDIDSPGGSVDGVPELAAEVRASRGTKPIVAQVNTLAASAAYWLAAQTDEIAITPSGEVGSIGVFAMHQDISRAADAAGVTTTLVSAGKYKVEGNEFEPLTDEARSHIQSQVDTFYRMFVADIAKGRGVSTSVVGESYGQGRTMLAKEAKAAGMVDHIATLEETVRRLQPRARAGARLGSSTLIGASSVTWFVPDELAITEPVTVTTTIEPAAEAASKESRDAFIAAQQRKGLRK